MIALSLHKLLKKHEVKLFAGVGPRFAFKRRGNVYLCECGKRWQR